MKVRKIGTYEINKISLSCFDDKIYVLKMDMMDYLLDVRVSYKNVVILITIHNSFFVKL